MEYNWFIAMRLITPSRASREIEAARLSAIERMDQPLVRTDRFIVARDVSVCSSSSSRRRGFRVVVLERETTPSRASYNNQARVHNGYH
jgi:hypothetical protein